MFSFIKTKKKINTLKIIYLNYKKIIEKYKKKQHLLNEQTNKLFEIINASSQAPNNINNILNIICSIDCKIKEYNFLINKEENQKKVYKNNKLLLNNVHIKRDNLNPNQPLDLNIKLKKII